MLNSAEGRIEEGMRLMVSKLTESVAHLRTAVPYKFGSPGGIDIDTIPCIKSAQILDLRGLIHLR